MQEAPEKKKLSLLLIKIYKTLLVRSSTLSGQDIMQESPCFLKMRPKPEKVDEGVDELNQLSPKSRLLMGEHKFLYYLSWVVIGFAAGMSHCNQVIPFQCTLNYLK
jgi:hypothetical protein